MLQRLAHAPWWAIGSSALLAGLCARGGWGWPLVFVIFVPWLLCLGSATHWRAALARGAWMAMAFTAAVFPWFGAAVGQATQWGTAAGCAVLVLLGPLLQPQFVVYALVRHACRRRTRTWAAAAAACAWVATEALVPKLLGDTLGHGLYPSRLLRQAADVGGAAGLTLLLLLGQEALAAAWAARKGRWLQPLAWAAAVPALLALYGWATPNGQVPKDTPTLRMALVQTAITDYERLRREKGTAAVVREVLDTHYAMSHDAVERQRAQAVLWSETVYPTTFAQPKSEAGVELDREIVGIVNAAGVPFVFGTYDRDAGGEYNAAAFVAPGRGLLGMYRKTYPFPLTEWVPAWADSATLRAALPWLGSWQPGHGARVFPLLLRDGREVPVLPLICLDAVHPQLAVDGARLGAAVILALSNDSWFTQHPHGAELHLAVAAFRSIETRLPQFRVTSNGLSAVIDVDGSVLARTKMGERTLVLGDLPVRTPPRTLMVAWGDWVGRAAALVLLGMALLAAARTWLPVPHAQAAAPEPLPWRMALLPPVVRGLIAALRLAARGALLWMAWATVTGSEAWSANTLAQLRAAALWWAVPELLAWLLWRAYQARLDVAAGMLVFTQGARRLELPLAQITALEAWRLPWPWAGTWLRMGRQRYGQGLAGVRADALHVLLKARGLAEAPALESTAWVQRFEQARHAGAGGWLQHPALKVALLSFLLAVPAYRLHQHIAFGAGLGEWQAFGAWAFARGFALWWAAWALGVLVCAGVLRALIETVSALAAWRAPALALPVRLGLERAGLVLLYLGLPAWLAWRALG